MFCFLHISDLHRAASDPITNAELISALISDRDRYRREDPPVPPPDAIVVSGDLIQGVGLGHSDFEAALAEQYEVAGAFLEDLCRRFLDGDKSRVVLIPGNHDVDWNRARSAMSVVATKDIPNDLRGAIHDARSPYRWDWERCELLTISDAATYHLRLQAFWRCFEAFYAGVDNLLKVAPWSNANLYNFDQGRIGLAAFNSCDGNDCFAFHGRIQEEAIAQSHLDLNALGSWRLRVAVWHHNIEGPPYRSDYMDPEIVRGMIGRGFRLGLYGHQHRAEAEPKHINLPARETMAVVSAGSLCAGRRELPTGQNRGYSLIEINDDYLGARVHVREMAFANNFSRANLSAFGGRSFADVHWSVPVDAAGRPENQDQEQIHALIRSAERALKENNDPQAALSLLKGSVAVTVPFGRRLLLEAAEQAADWETIINILAEPGSIGELVLVIDAMLALNAFDRADALLSEHAPRLQLDVGASAELRRKIDLLRRMRP